LDESVIPGRKYKSYGRISLCIFSSYKNSFSDAGFMHVCSYGDHDPQALETLYESGPVGNDGTPDTQKPGQVFHELIIPAASPSIRTNLS
jgi:hypothetical protein